MQDSIVNPETIRDVDVCACTFRRASVVDLLRSLAATLVVLAALWFAALAASRVERPTDG